MRIDERKLANNNDLSREIKTMKSPRESQKDSYLKKLSEDITFIVLPNDYIFEKPNRRKLGKKILSPTIKIFWKQVSIGYFHERTNHLIIDIELKKDDWFKEKLLPIINKELPTKDFSLDYGVHYIDWDNRPFYVTKC